MHLSSTNGVRLGHGLQKVIVAATENGMLFALDSVTGRHMWKTQVPFGEFDLVTMDEHHVQSNDHTLQNDPKSNTQVCVLSKKFLVVVLHVFTHSLLSSVQVLMVRSGLHESVIVLFDLRTGVLISLKNVAMRVTHVHSVEHAGSSFVLLSQITNPFSASVPVSSYPGPVMTDSSNPHVTLWAADKQNGTIGTVND